MSRWILWRVWGYPVEEHPLAGSAAEPASTQRWPTPRPSTPSPQGHGHPHSDNQQRIGVAFLLNFVFTIIEIFGGIWTNSTAILADAVHDLGDSLALGSSWFLERKSLQKGDTRFTYGYRRFSLLGALISTAVLVFGSTYVLSEAVQRLFHPEPSYAPGMVGLAVLGILLNGIAVLRLRKGEGLNVRIVTWHLLEDVLGWVMVLLVSVVLMFVDLFILDPLLSILITLYILRNVLINLKATMNVFLQGSPKALMQRHRRRRLPRPRPGRRSITSTSDPGRTASRLQSAHLVLPHTATKEDAIDIKQRYAPFWNVGHFTCHTRAGMGRK